MNGYAALVQTGREALREGGAGLNSTYEEDAAMVLAAVLPHIADLLRQDTDPDLIGETVHYDDGDYSRRQRSRQEVRERLAAEVERMAASAEAHAHG